MTLLKRHDCHHNFLIMAVRTGKRVYLSGQTGTTLDGEFTGEGDPGAQAEQAMANIEMLFNEAGATVNDICKITTYIGDHAYRNDVYNVMGRWLKGVHPVGTGLIVNGFASPRILVEIDVEAGFKPPASSNLQLILCNWF
jgi:enamine deaminase RidA (YjgF/YER057c/UK114 family)